MPSIKDKSRFAATFVAVNVIDYKINKYA